MVVIQKYKMSIRLLYSYFTQLKYYFQLILLADYLIVNLPYNMMVSYEKYTRRCSV